MKRRDFLRTTLAASPVRAAERPPSVLFIICDQLNPAVISPYGGPVSTPHIERIARRGVTFTEATCPTPFCSPSRASIATGLYPHAHGIVHNVMRKDYPAAPGPVTEEGLTRDDLTTEKILRADGYATHHYGKWHLSGDALPYFPDRYGEHHEYAREMAETFERVRRRPREEWMDWYGWALPVRVDSVYRRAVESSKEFARGPLGDFIQKIGKLEWPVEQVFDARVADKTVQRLRAIGPEPFMITCSFNTPHDPNVAPSPYYEAWRPEKIELPANAGRRAARFEKELSRWMTGSGEDRIRECLRVYYACIRLLDDQVGRVLDALEASGRKDDTVVVFTSDHGDMAGGHGMFWKSTTAFYEEIVRVPLIVSDPRRLRRSTSGAAASLTDLAPTLLDLAGRKVPAGMQGRSLLPALEGGGGDGYTYSERVEPNPARTRRLTPGTPTSLMIRGQGWKYCRYPDGEEFLYNLRRDPGEIRNLAGERALRNQKTELAGKLRAWLERSDPARVVAM